MRFSLKNLFLALSLIGVGLGMLCMLGAYDDTRLSVRMFLPPPQLWFLSGMAIGAGVFALFNKPLQGALVGLAFQAALFLLLFLFGQHL